MTKANWKDTAELIGIAAIVASLIFVAIEIRTNTESNKIAIEQNYSSNWLAINTSIAENPELADVVAKGDAGEELDRREARQYQAVVQMYLSQVFHMLRLYDDGLISEDEVRSAFRGVREAAKRGRFRDHVNEVGNERRRSLIVDPDGLDKWLNVEP
jgi:hypothetical protein